MRASVVKLPFCLLHIDRSPFVMLDQAGAFFDVGLSLPRTDFYPCCSFVMRIPNILVKFKANCILSTITGPILLNANSNFQRRGGKNMGKGTIQSVKKILTEWNPLDPEAERVPDLNKNG
jgi:hypothetical protein